MDRSYDLVSSSSGGSSDEDAVGYIEFTFRLQSASKIPLFCRNSTGFADYSRPPTEASESAPYPWSPHLLRSPCRYWTHVSCFHATTTAPHFSSMAFFPSSRSSMAFGLRTMHPIGVVRCKGLWLPVTRDVRTDLGIFVTGGADGLWSGFRHKGRQ
jgi:hypothetical protein